MRVQRDLHTDVLLREGDVTVSLQGSGALFALNRQTQALDLLCTTNGTYTADVSQWRDTYCDDDRQAQAFLLCASPGSGVITHGYSHPQDADVTCAKTLSYSTYSIRAMQITSDANAYGRLYNPCGIATGGSAKFRVEVEPASIPDTRIVWSVAQGGVSFAGGNNKGRTVTVSGGASEASFRLEIDVTDGNLHQKPFFTGKALNHVQIPVTVWIVRENNGQNPAITEAQLSLMMANVNTLYEQTAMEFTLNGGINYTNASSLGNIFMTNAVDSVSPILLNLPKNSADGIKLIFIKNISDFNGTETEICGGFHHAKGIVLGAQDPNFNHRIIAHEIGHACELEDIYVPTSIDKYIPSGEDLHRYAQSDWAGGYCGGVEYGSLVRTLLMFGNFNAERGDPMSDISTGIVFGSQDLSGSSQSADWIKTGLTSPMNRHPVHQ